MLAVVAGANTCDQLREAQGARPDVDTRAPDLPLLLHLGPQRATLYVEATTAGVVSINTTGWTSGSIPLYRIVTGAAAVSSYEDWRCMALAVKP